MFPYSKTSSLATLCGPHVPNGKGFRPIVVMRRPLLDPVYKQPAATARYQSVPSPYVH